MKLNKRGQIDFDEFSLMGVVFGLVGGMISIIITARMGGGLPTKLIGFAVTGIVCYFVGSKIADE